MLAIDPVLQHSLIAAASAASALYLVHRQWPQAIRRARVFVAARLLRSGHVGLAKRIAPQAPVGTGACGACNGCGPSGQ